MPLLSSDERKQGNQLQRPGIRGSTDRHGSSQHGGAYPRDKSMSDRPCTCHPDDNPPVPCPQKFALSECKDAPDAATVELPPLPDIEQEVYARTRTFLRNDEIVAVGQLMEVYASEAIRAAVERVIAENLQRGNVIGRISAHLLGNKNNVSDEDVVIAASEAGRALQGARERAERAEQEAAELRKDAERYRWLRGGSDVPAHSVRWGRWEINHWEGANGWRNLLCSELDAAIDAAMKEEK